jgi:hypothetical protein
MIGPKLFRKPPNCKNSFDLALVSLPSRQLQIRPSAGPIGSLAHIPAQQSGAEILRRRNGVRLGRLCGVAPYHDVVYEVYDQGDAQPGATSACSVGRTARGAFSAFHGEVKACRECPRPSRRRETAGLRLRPRRATLSPAHHAPRRFLAIAPRYKCAKPPGGSLAEDAGDPFDIPGDPARQPVAGGAGALMSDSLAGPPPRVDRQPPKASSGPPVLTDAGPLFVSGHKPGHNLEPRTSEPR